MQWIELSLHTTHEAIDWVRTLLATVDFTGNIGVTQYTQPSQPWAFTVRLALPHTQATTHAETIHRLLSPLERTGMTTALEIEILDQQPVYTDTGIYQIGRFVILPPDQSYEAMPNQVLLRLATTLAFGSGLHPATVLSLRLLERYVTPTINALDLGCGSGILSVAMAKLGAQVLALDNDPTAVQATHQAAHLNAVASNITVEQGSLASGSDLGHWMGGSPLEKVPVFNPVERFDLIAANILARIHITLVPDYKQALRRQTDCPGRVITAGFTTDQEQDVAMALTQAGFTAIDCEQLGEWVALVHQIG